MYMKMQKILMVLIISVFIPNLFAQDSSDLLKKNILSNDAYLKKENANKIRFIYYVLLNTNEVYAHNLGGATKNKVYVAKDGHVELVYGEDGKLVTDDMNQGSYNYYSVFTSPLEHFAADSYPWILWGNTQKDPSTRKERATAFAKDFLDGVYRVVMNWKKTKEIKPNEIKNDMQKNVLNFFLTIFSDPVFKNDKFDGKVLRMKGQKAYDDFENRLKNKLIEYLLK